MLLEAFELIKTGGCFILIFYQEIGIDNSLMNIVPMTDV
jgi:hypothetical protein